MLCTEAVLLPACHMRQHAGNDGGGEHEGADSSQDQAEPQIALHERTARKRVVSVGPALQTAAAPSLLARFTPVPRPEHEDDCDNEHHAARNIVQDGCQRLEGALV